MHSLLHFISFTLISIVISVVSAQTIYWSNLTASELRSLNYSQLATASLDDIASIPVEACFGFSYSQIESISPSAIPGFSPNQIRAIHPQAFSGFNATQIANLSIEACSALSRGPVQELQDDALFAMSLTQLANFSASGVSGINGDRLIKLYYTFGMDFVNLYPAERFEELHLEDMVTFKSSIPELIEPVLPLPDSWTEFNWMQFALLYENVSSISNFWNEVPRSTVGGIRSDQVQKVLQEPSMAKDISESQGMYLPPEMFAVLSVDQLTNISASVFCSIMPITINAMPLTLWHAMLPSQVTSLSPHVWEQLDCTYLTEMTKAQRKGLTTAGIYNYNQRAIQCGTSTISESKTPEIVGGVLGAAGFVFLVAGFGYFMYKYRNMPPKQNNKRARKFEQMVEESLADEEGLEDVNL